MDSPIFTALSSRPSFAFSIIPFFCLSILRVLVLTSGSRFLSVTGRVASFNSIIPKRAENFARGGYESVLTVSGNLSLFANALPASSFISFGSSTTNEEFSEKGPLNAIA